MAYKSALITWFMHFKALFFAVLLDVCLHCLFSVPSGVNHMAPRCMSMVCSHCVFPGIVVLGRFVVVPCGMHVRCLLVVFGGFLRHMIFSVSS
jgi:hypothetical protein